MIRSNLHGRPQDWLVTLGAALLLLVATPGLAFDGAGSGGGGGGGEPPPEGGSAPSGPTYYESVLGGAPLEALQTSSGGLPASLHVVEASGAAWYELAGSDPESLSWSLEAEVDERPHERVDAVYDVVVAIPLPAGATSGSSLQPREGSAERSVALVYGGEKVLLKRNAALERMWLPLIGGSAGGLPDLSGTGYEFTLWDAILRLDSSYGESVQARATLDYQSGLAVTAPDASDDRLGVYVINWIPTLDPTIPPYTLRLDVIEAP